MGLPGLRIMCLAQGHREVPPVRREPPTPISRVQHSTAELVTEISVNSDQLASDEAI